MSLNEKRQAHIDCLARGMGCQLDQKPGLDGMMFVEFSRVEGPVIEDQIDYLSMLHELGHFAHGHTQGRPPHGDQKFYFDNGVLRSEAQAWDWALDNCPEPIQYVSRRFMWDVCLGSYYSMAIGAGDSPTRIGNGNRHHVLFVHDKADDYFASVVKRIQGDSKGFVIPFPLPTSLPFPLWGRIKKEMQVIRSLSRSGDLLMERLGYEAQGTPRTEVSSLPEASVL